MRLCPTRIEGDIVMRYIFTMMRLVFGVILLIAVTSCSKSKVESLMEQIPADVDMVAVCDVKSLVESLDGTVNGSSIQVPDDVFSVLYDSEKNRLNEFLSDLNGSGIDVGVCALFSNLNDKYGLYIVVSVDDPDSFANTLKDEDYVKKDEKNGYAFYVKKSDCYTSFVVIKDSYAYLLPEVHAGGDDVLKQERHIVKVLGKAEKKPFSTTNMSKYIAESNAGGMSLRLSDEVREFLEREGLPSDIADKSTAYACCRFDLNDNIARLTMKMFDKDGEVMKIDDFNDCLDMNATLNPEAMKYLHNDEFLLAGFTLKDVDWDKIGESLGDVLPADDMAVWIVVKSYLEKIDGTVACGVGIKDGKSSFFDIGSKPNDNELLAATLVVEIKKGKAQSIVNDMKVLLEKEGIPFNETAGGLKIPEIGDFAMITLNVEAKDNYLIISNFPVKQYDNAILKNLDLKDFNAIAVLDLQKGNLILDFLGIDDRVKVVLSSNVNTMEVTLDLEFGEHGKKGLLSKVLKTIIDIEQRAQLQDNLNTYGEYDEYDEDEAVVE